MLKKCPVMCKEYNQHMGGCDQCNALRASYSIHLTHQHRWYMCLIYYGLDTLIIASYIYFKAKTQKVNLTQKSFEWHLCRVFLLGRRSYGCIREEGHQHED